MVEDMREKQSRSDILLPWRFLDHPDVVTALEHMRGRELKKAWRVIRFTNPVLTTAARNARFSHRVVLCAWFTRQPGRASIGECPQDRTHPMRKNAIPRETFA
jgi:hypothetical protein